MAETPTGWGVGPVEIVGVPDGGAPGGGGSLWERGTQWWETTLDSGSTLGTLSWWDAQGRENTLFKVNTVWGGF